MVPDVIAASANGTAAFDAGVPEVNRGVIFQAHAAAVNRVTVDNLGTLVKVERAAAVDIHAAAVAVVAVAVQVRAVVQVQDAVAADLDQGALGPQPLGVIALGALVVVLGAVQKHGFQVQHRAGFHAEQGASVTSATAAPDGGVLNCDGLTGGNGQRTGKRVARAFAWTCEDDLARGVNLRLQIIKSQAAAELDC